MWQLTSQTCAAHPSWSWPKDLWLHKCWILVFFLNSQCVSINTTYCAGHTFFYAVSHFSFTLDSFHIFISTSLKQNIFYARFEGSSPLGEQIKSPSVIVLWSFVAVFFAFGHECYLAHNIHFTFREKNEGRQSGWVGVVHLH